MSATATESCAGRTAMRLSIAASKAMMSLNSGDFSRARLIASEIGVEAETVIRALLQQDRPAADVCLVCGKRR